MRRGSFVLFILSIICGAEPALSAEKQTFRGNYTVSILGLTIARSTFNSTFDGNRFSIRGSLKSAGLARLFDDTTGTLSVEGRIADAARPDRFRTDYQTGKKKHTIEILFSDGNVTETVTRPAPPRKRRNWVPLAEGDLDGVVDPISATLIRTDKPEEVCRRTLHVYDGEMRADVVLSPSERSRSNKADDAVTCNARVKPISGYRSGRKALEFLRDRSRITITFEPLGATGLYVAVHATVGTEIGTLTIKAQRPSPAARK